MAQKIIKIITIIFVLTAIWFNSLSCYATQTKTPIQWCLSDILNDEEYQKNDVIGWTSEKLECAAYSGEYYGIYCFVVKIICDTEEGNGRIDYWLCYAVIKQRCVHNAIDIFRDKHSEKAQICGDCVLTDCDMFKQEIIY